MKRTHKNILGFFGLVVVAAMTVVAAVLPIPEAKAVSSTITDSIVVTVSPPPYTAHVRWTDHTNYEAYVNSKQDIGYRHDGVEHVVITMSYKDASGATTNTVLVDQTVLPAGASERLLVDLATWGYGEYEFKLEGDGSYGIAPAEYIRMAYVPVKAEVVEDPNDGKIYDVLDYDDTAVDLDHFIIDVYDEAGNLVTVLSNIRVDKPDKKVELKFAENNITDGKYRISTRAIDTNGQLVYKAWDVVFFWQQPMKVPNTGGLWFGLNISKADYLITGLIVFSVVGLGGIYFIAKDKKTAKRRR